MRTKVATRISSPKSEEENETKVVGKDVRGANAVVKAGLDIRLAHAYQSVGVFVGVELPVKMESKADIDEAFVEADRIVSAELKRRLPRAEKLLATLGKTYGGR